MRNHADNEELRKLLAILPTSIRERLESHPQLDGIIEIVLDLGKPPEARFEGTIFVIQDDPVTSENLEYVVSHLGQFTSDNRAGIERTLHRISAIRNRMGRIIGLT